MTKVEAVVVQRARRDRHRRGRGADRPRRRHGGRGGRPRPPARDHARVPRADLRVAVPAEGAADLRRRRRAGRDRRRRDRRRGPDGTRVRRRARLDDAGRPRHPQPHGPAAGGGRDRDDEPELAIAASTIWVVVAAVLVMFMQAGFAFLEAGLTRMKNVGHIAAKNVLIFAIASIVVLRRRLRDRVRRRRQRARRRLGLHALGGRAARGRRGAVLVVRVDPGRGGVPLPGRVRGVSLAIVWGAMAERTKLWVYFAFSVVFTLDLLRRLALDLGRERLAVRARDAGLRRLDRRPLPGRAGRARGRAAARAADRQVRLGRQAERDPGAQHGVHDARRADPLVRLVRLQPRLDARRRLRRRSASSPTSR